MYLYPLEAYTRLASLANNLPNNNWPNRKKKKIKIKIHKQTKPEKKKTTCVSLSKLVFRVVDLVGEHLAISSGNLMRVFLSFAFSLSHSLRLFCFASFLKTFFRFCFDNVSESLGCSTLFSFFCWHRCLFKMFRVQRNCWGRALIRDGESFENLVFFYFVLLFPLFPFQPTKAKEWR